MSPKSKSREKHARLAAALLLRMLTVTTLLLTANRSYMIISPWPRDGEDQDLRKHGLAKIIRKDMASGYDLGEVSYQVISNMKDCHAADSLYDSIKVGIYTMTTTSCLGSKVINPPGQ